MAKGPITYVNTNNAIYDPTALIFRQDDGGIYTEITTEDANNPEETTTYKKYLSSNETNLRIAVAIESLANQTQDLQTQIDNMNGIPVAEIVNEDGTITSIKNVNTNVQSLFVSTTKPTTNYRIWIQPEEDEE